MYHAKPETQNQLDWIAAKNKLFEAKGQEHFVHVTEFLAPLLSAANEAPSAWVVTQGRASWGWYTEYTNNVFFLHLASVARIIS